MANFFYNEGKELLDTGSIEWEQVGGTVDLRVLMLEVVDNGTLTQQKSRATIAAVLATAANELSSTGYARQPLENPAKIQDDTDDEIEYTADDIAFGALTQLAAEEAVAAIIYLHVSGDDADNIPVMYVDSGFPVTPNGENFFLRWEGSVAGSDGVVFRLQDAP